MSDFPEFQKLSFYKETPTVATDHTEPISKMETAKDITPSNRDKELWSAASIIIELFNAQQEYTQQDWYDWLKEFTEKREMEIADKAWGAGAEHADECYCGKCSYCLERRDKLAPYKSTFMKSLFPLKEI